MRVVGRLELVDVAEDDGQWCLVTLAAGNLGEQPLFAVAPVREPGEPVGSRLQGGRFVEPCVLERIRALGDQSPGCQQVVLIELGRVQDQNPEAGLVGGDRELEGLGVVREGSDLDDRAVLAEQDRSLGIRSLDGGRGDQRQELVDVVGRRQQVAGAAERLSQPGPVKLQLQQPGPQLIGHRVERAGQVGELVAAAHGHAPIEPAAADRLRRAGKLAHRAHDRPGLGSGDRRQHEQGSK